MQGLCQIYGYGAPEGSDVGVLTLREAADRGSGRAMLALAECCVKGLIPSGTADQAIEWIVRAARTGEADAMLILASVFESGQGVRRDASEAFFWYSQAAQRGSTEGMYHAALALYTGQGASKDEYRAMVWMKRAAQAGHPQAVETLAEYERDRREALARREAELRETAERRAQAVANDMQQEQLRRTAVAAVLGLFIIAMIADSPAEEVYVPDSRGMGVCGGCGGSGSVDSEPTYNSFTERWEGGGRVTCRSCGGSGHR